MKKCYKYNMNNVGAGLVPAQLQRNTQKGITLVALVITIIVLLILAVASINLLINNGIIGKAKGATFKSEIKAYEEELKLSIANDQIDKLGQRTEKFNVKRKNYNNSQSFTQAMREKIPSFKEKYAEKLEIQEDELVYIGMDEEERNWFKEAKMNVAKLLEIKYVDEEGNQIAETYKKIIEDETYSVIPPEVEGYLPDTFLVEGKLTKDTIITVTYYRESRDLAFEGLDASGNVTEVEADIVSYQVAGIGNFTGTNLVIPEIYNGKSVIKIKEYAFRGNTIIKEIIVNDNIYKIGTFAFQNCSKLKKANLNVKNIERYAFFCCRLLESVTLSGQSVNTGDCIFSGCSNLWDFKIETESLSVGLEIFQDCSKLEEIKTNNDNNSYKEINGIVYSKDGTKLILYPTGKNGEFTFDANTKEIGTCAFANQTKLEKIEIPDSITKIGNFAFQGSKIKKVIFNSNNLAREIFRKCNELQEIEIGMNVKTFGRLVFYSDSKLENINYLGTIEQWNKISKSSEWNYGISGVSIICTDGTIEL